jgi:hypothetical protein
MVKVIARAFRWREMLENGTHATIAGIAAVETVESGSLLEWSTSAFCGPSCGRHAQLISLP